MLIRRFVSNLRRQFNGCRRSLSWTRSQFDDSVLCGDQLLRSSQAESRLATSGFLREERVECVRQRVIIHAVAVVLDHDDQSVIRSGGFRFNINEFLRIGLERIHNQFHQRQTYLFTVDNYFSERFRDRYIDRNMRVTPDARGFDDTSDHVREIDGVGLGLGRIGKDVQTGNEIAESMRLFDDLFGHSLVLQIIDLESEYLRSSGNDGEWVVHFMRGAGGEFTERGHDSGMFELGLSFGQSSVGFGKLFSESSRAVVLSGGGDGGGPGFAERSKDGSYQSAFGEIPIVKQDGGKTPSISQGEQPYIPNVASIAEAIGDAREESHYFDRYLIIIRQGLQNARSAGRVDDLRAQKPAVVSKLADSPLGGTGGGNEHGIETLAEFS